MQTHLKVRKRAKVACTRCSAHKIKCSGERPICRSCSISNNDACFYPTKARKITVLDTDIQKMQERIQELENECKQLRQAARSDGIEFPEGTSVETVDGLENGIGGRNNSPASNDGIQHLLSTHKEHLGSVAPGIGPEMPGNSSCRIFVDALQWHLTKNYITSNRSNYTTEQDNKDDLFTKGHPLRHIYVDDKALGEEQSVRMFILPQKTYGLKLVHKVFKFFAREYGIFSITEFEARLEDTYKDIQSQNANWLAYLLITFAVGEQYLGKVEGHQKIPGMEFFLTALKFFHEPIEEPNLDTVRTLLLIAFYSQGLNRRNSVFAYTGLAISTAIILGIHRQAVNSRLPKPEQEARKKLWWTACLMDSLWASRLGLPPHFNVSDIDIELPDSSMSSEDGFVPKYLTANTRLALCVGTVMKEVYGVSRGNDLLPNILSSLECLDSFFTGLPPDLKIVPEKIKENRSTANLHLRYNQIIIVATRPLYLQLLKKCDGNTIEMENVRRRCVNAAVSNIKILSNLWNSGWFSAYGFLEAQCCFSALLILVMATLDGGSFPELSIAVSLNTYMCEKGNITAMDNHCRLKELDGMLLRAERDRKQKVQSALKIQSLEAEIGEAPKDKHATTPDDRSQYLSKDKSVQSSESDQASCASNLAYLVDLESSGTGFEQFSPETLYNLSVNFQNWDTNTDFL